MTTIKLLSLLTRRHDLSLDQFSQHWRTIHKDLALRLVEPGFMLGYVQNHRRPHPIEGVEPPADGAPEVWIPDTTTLQALGSSPAYLEGAYVDEPEFMVTPPVTLVTEETVVQEGPGREEAANLVKTLFVYRRAAGLSQEDFSRQWRDTPHPLTMPAAEPLRITRLTAVEDPDQGLERSAYDGVECCWWPDIETFEAAWAKRNPGEATALVERDTMAGMIVREEPVLWPR